MQQRETLDAARLVLCSGPLSGAERARELRLVKHRVTIGRRPGNDLVLDHLTVSGEHALVITTDGTHRIRDLGSRNGTLVNGSSVAESPLVDGDIIEVGVHRIEFIGHGARARADARDALVDVLNGPRAGERVALERAITPIGGPGAHVAVIARRRNGYYLTHLEGMSFPQVNGESIGLMAHALSHGDLIEVGGTMLCFRFGA